MISRPFWIFIRDGLSFCGAHTPEKRLEPIRPLLRSVPSVYMSESRYYRLMDKKLVYMAGTPYWLLPQGHFRPVEKSDGRIVDPILFRRRGESWNERQKCDR